MKKIWPWILGISLLLVSTVVLILFGSRVLSFGPSIIYPNRETSRLWPGGLWHHHDGTRFGIRGMPFMGILGWIGMLIIPFGLLGLFVLGIILLVGGITTSRQEKDLPRPLRCENCRRQVETDWAVCPYCGDSLKVD